MEERIGFCQHYRSASKLDRTGDWIHIYAPEFDRFVSRDPGVEDLEFLENQLEILDRNFAECKSNRDQLHHDRYDARKLKERYEEELINVSENDTEKRSELVSKIEEYQTLHSEINSQYNGAQSRMDVFECLLTSSKDWIFRLKNGGRSRRNSTGEFRISDLEIYQKLDPEKELKTLEMIRWEYRSCNDYSKYLGGEFLVVLEKRMNALQMLLHVKEATPKDNDEKEQHPTRKGKLDITELVLLISYLQDEKLFIRLPDLIIKDQKKINILIAELLGVNITQVIDAQKKVDPIRRGKITKGQKKWKINNLNNVKPFFENLGLKNVVESIEKRIEGIELNTK